MSKKEQSKGKNNSTLAGVLIFVMIVFSLIFCITVLYLGYFKPNKIYNTAKKMVSYGDDENAIVLFSSIDGWHDARKQRTDCYMRMFEKTLEKDNFDSTLELYDVITNFDESKKEILLHDIYDYAKEKMKSGQLDVALNIYSEVLKGYMDSDYIYNEYFYRESMEKLDEGNFIEAYNILYNIDSSLIPEVTEKIEICKKTVYEKAVDDFYNINMKNDVLRMDIVLPVEFMEPMLDGYMDTDNFRLYACLVGAWSGKDRDKNTEIVYELGDFLNVKENGFAMQRLFQRKYINSWTYFYLNGDGEVETNIPHYRLSGYYGLYSKIENGVYYIGSDEARWTKQFSFRFDDFDKTLYVYSYYSGYEYRLERDENPIYVPTD